MSNKNQTRAIRGREKASDREFKKYLLIVLTQNSVIKKYNNTST